MKLPKLFAHPESSKQSEMDCNRNDLHTNTEMSKLKESYLCFDSIQNEMAQESGKG